MWVQIQSESKTAPRGITEVINVFTRAVCARARQKWAKTRRKLEPQVQTEADWSDEIQPFPLREVCILVSAYLDYLGLARPMKEQQCMISAICPVLRSKKWT